MCLHNVLFKLSVLISRFRSLPSEDGVNTLHFLVRSWITLSQCLLAELKEDSLSWLPLEHLIIHKGHSGIRGKADGRWDRRNTFRRPGADAKRLHSNQKSELKHNRIMANSSTPLSQKYTFDPFLHASKHAIFEKIGQKFFLFQRQTHQDISYFIIVCAMNVPFYAFM